MTDKTIVSKKTYTIEVIEYEDGTTQMIRRNDQFNSFELLGRLVFIQHEILDQINGKFKPDFVKREVIEK